MRALPRRRRAALGGVALAALAAGAVAAAGDADRPARPAAAASGATAAVERRDLVDRETVDGTLGYAGSAPLTTGLQGTLTRLPESGTVVTRGHALLELDGRPAAFLLYGERPAWRDLAPAISDGEDVRQLERNLRALGHDPDHAMTVDDHWTAATTAAVLRFQKACGLTRDGALARGEVVFRPGAVRIGRLKAAEGQAVQPGMEIAEVSSTRREVTVELDATRQDLAHRGDAVTVELPTGATARGRIAEVGKVAEKGAGQDAEATIEVRVALRGRAARGTGLDQAPVDVGLVRERARDVLTVPLTALLARAGGGYAVEVVEAGHRRLVPVRPGLYADDRVEVSGGGLREGQRVVVPE